MSQYDDFIANATDCFLAKAVNYANWLTLGKDHCENKRRIQILGMYFDELPELVTLGFITDDEIQGIFTHMSMLCGEFLGRVEDIPTDLVSECGCGEQVATGTTGGGTGGGSTPGTTGYYDSGILTLIANIPQTVTFSNGLVMPNALYIIKIMCYDEYGSSQQYTIPPNSITTTGFTISTIVDTIVRWEIEYR